MQELILYSSEYVSESGTTTGIANALINKTGVYSATTTLTVSDKDWADLLGQIENNPKTLIWHHKSSPLFRINKTFFSTHKIAAVEIKSTQQILGGAVLNIAVFRNGIAHSIPFNVSLETYEKILVTLEHLNNGTDLDKYFICSKELFFNPSALISAYIL